MDESYQSPVSSAEVKNKWSHTSYPHEFMTNKGTRLHYYESQS